MAATVALAVEAGAAVGAHPSFRDQENFGRKALPTPPAELRNQVLSQRSNVCLRWPSPPPGRFRLSTWIEHPRLLPPPGREGQR